MNKKAQTPKLVGKWIGLGLLFLGIVGLIIALTTENWNKIWLGMVIGVLGVIVMLISRKWL